jgi:hypothetical protein
VVEQNDPNNSQITVRLLQQAQPDLLVARFLLGLETRLAAAANDSCV